MDISLLNKQVERKVRGEVLDIITSASMRWTPFPRPYLVTVYALQEDDGEICYGTIEEAKLNKGDYVVATLGRKSPCTYS